MHAGIRRVPAERARHAKRLGHALPVPPDSAKAETTQQAITSSLAPATSATSAISSLSSAHISSSATSPSSSLPSSAATQSSSSAATSTSALPLTASAPSAPLITSSVALTPTPLTPSHTSTPQTNATHSGLSGGAIAGIIAGATIVGAALVVFFVRKTYLRRRERKRISWSGAPGLGTGINDDPKHFTDTSERRASFSSVANTPRTVPPSPFAVHGQSMHSAPVAPPTHMQPPNIPTYPVPIPPLATYNNPTPVAAYPTQPVPAPYGPSNYPHVMSPGAAGAGILSTLSSVRASHAPMEAVVKCTFVPNLPDELSITTGERIFIVEQYDDGWNLCANVRGERGMVPRECLEHVRIDQPDVTWRNVGRTSSLNPDGQRY